MFLSLSKLVVRSHWNVSSIRDVLFLDRLMWNPLSCDCYWLSQSCSVFSCRKTVWGWMHLRFTGFWFILIFLIISALNQLWLFLTVCWISGICCTCEIMAREYWEVQKLTVQNIAWAGVSPPHLFPNSVTETIQVDWLFPAADVRVKHHE